MVVGYLEDGPPLAHSALRQYVPVGVLSRQVPPRLEGYGQAQVGTRGVFVARQQPVVQLRIEVVTLAPGHLAGLGQLSESQHDVGLVASALLALPGSSQVVGQRAVVCSVAIVVQGTLVLLPVVAVDGKRHPHLVHRGSPVAVGIGRKAVELIQHRQEGASQHSFRGAGVGLGPSGVFVAEQFAGIHQDEALQGSTERSIVPLDSLQTEGVCANDVQGGSGMGLLASENVEETVVVGRQEIVLAGSLGASVLPVAGDDVKGSGNGVGGRCLRVGDEFPVRAQGYRVLVYYPLACSLDGFPAV